MEPTRADRRRTIYHAVAKRKRTKTGLAAARACGRNGGRPKVTAKEARVVLAKKLHADKSLDIDDICNKRQPFSDNADITVFSDSNRSRMNRHKHAEPS